MLSRNLLRFVTVMITAGAVASCSSSGNTPARTVPVPTVTVTETPSSTRSTAPALAQTHEVVYDASSGVDKPAPGLTVAATFSGHCSGSNVDVRSDAYRCYITGALENGSNILDPCYGGIDVRTRLYCVESPTDTSVVQVNVAGHIKYPDLDQPQRRQFPWAVRLTTGDVCVLLGGATYVVGGQRDNYGCPHHHDLFGDPDRTTPVWTIFAAREGSQSLTDHVEIATAWF